LCAHYFAVCRMGHSIKTLWRRIDVKYREGVGPLNYLELIVCARQFHKRTS
jgi:hypothetical protein